MDRALLSERLDTACRTFETLERQLADPALASDPGRLQSLARERARLEPLVADYRQLQRLEREEEEAQSLLREHRGDPAMEEISQLAAEELLSLGDQLAALRQRLTLALLPLSMLKTCLMSFLGVGKWA